MSSTATASRPAARRVWAPRWLVVLHRYLGVAVGLLMLVWCLSGIVMLFVHWPKVTEAQRVTALPAISWAGCCRIDPSAAAAVQVESAQVEDLGGAPLLRLRMASGEREAFDLRTGTRLHHVSALTAAQVAARFGGSKAVDIKAVERDQWTVTGYFDKDRPFWKVRLAEGGTDVYVAHASGLVVQKTTATGRVLNWLGAIPHWLYPSILRADTKLWTQVVVWTSLLGVFLTIAGIYLGLVMFRPGHERGPTPYRGLMAWHHITGLVAGLLTLTWVLSGLFSMNPWGLLESQPDDAEVRITGERPTLGDLQAALIRLAQAAPDAKVVKLAQLDGKLFLVADAQRFAADAAPAPLTPADLAAAGRRLGEPASQGLITSSDAYYFSHHDAVALPAWRVVLRDGRRFYLDPTSGELLASFDAAAQGFRWAHLGLHRLDFIPGFSSGAGWATTMVVLLLAVSLGVAIGVWLAWRRIKHDLGQWMARP